ncbi:ATP-dependent DNA helicase [Trichonephila clavipes]|nr:ATP-dependent DNA helicase [Trichonephila clavipes]
MEEAVQCRSPDKIKELYATLLSSCGLSNPQTLWDKYKEYMADDILHQLQQKRQKIAVAVASSGIAATLLNGGRTTHAVLKLPLNLAQEDSPIFNFIKNSSRGKMLRECKLLVWDESTMSHKKAIEALNRTLQDLRESTDIMGGKVDLLPGDFRQTLPVIQSGTTADEI